MTGKKEIQYLQKRLKIELGETNNKKKVESQDLDDDENFWENHPEQNDKEKANLPKKVDILPLYS